MEQKRTRKSDGKVSSRAFHQAVSAISKHNEKTPSSKRTPVVSIKSECRSPNLSSRKTSRSEISKSNSSSYLDYSSESVDSGILSDVFGSPSTPSNCNFSITSAGKQNVNYFKMPSQIENHNILATYRGSSNINSPFSEVTSQTERLNFYSPNSTYATSAMKTTSSAAENYSPVSIKPPVPRKEYEANIETVDKRLVTDIGSDEGEWDSTIVETPRRSTSKKASITPKRKLTRDDDDDECLIKKIRTPDRKQCSYHSAKSPSRFSSRSHRYSDSCLYKRPSLSPRRRISVRKSIADRTPYNFSPVSNQDVRSRRFSFTSLPSYDADELQTCDVDFIDTHCHLDFLFKRCCYEGSYASYRANEDHFPKSYKGCVAVFCDPLTFQQKNIWEHLIEEDGVWASFGCHPHNAEAYDEIIDEYLIQALKHRKVVALGEIGLDYSIRNNVDKSIQRRVFKRQLKLAMKLDLPLVIHCREAHEDGYNIMKDMVREDHRIHLHCFTDEWETADMWLKGFSRLFIGITNVVTYPSATSVHEVVKNLPLNRLLIETDAPYFVPGLLKRDLRLSHPGMAIHVAAQIAAIRNVLLKEIMTNVRLNTKSMYHI